MAKSINVALIGNPNTGKTSVFNQLTGLNQKVGNYPGITVEKKEGICKLTRYLKAHIIDLPGTYSLNSTSLDESVAIELLLNRKDKDFPDVVVVVTDVENLKRNLLLFSQVKDLKIPAILVINMADQMEKKGIKLHIEELEHKLDTKIALVSARKGVGIDQLKNLIINYENLSNKGLLEVKRIDPPYFEKLEKTYPSQDLYKLWIVITQDVNFTQIDKTYESAKASFETKSASELKRLQHRETILRYQIINTALNETLSVDKNSAKGFTAAIDRILTHKICGYLIFFVILNTIFQAIYTWSSIPMDLIDEFFVAASSWVKAVLPPGSFTNLLAEGAVSGIGGIAIFIPQIAFLFLFIALLEESGYMSRVVFLTDRLMRPFGLSGKSVVPLISGTACAIPAVMATRTIEDWKERLLTILVVPFTTCSARLPVYLIIISIVIPEGYIFGLSYQALTLMLLYLVGILSALGAAALLNKIVKVKSRSFFATEMPSYKLPLFKNVVITVIEKTKSFVFGAGKIILAISIVLWFLGSYGFNKEFENSEQIIKERVEKQGLSVFNQQLIQEEIETYAKEHPAQNMEELAEFIAFKNNLERRALQEEIASFKLENSYMGLLGKGIAPIVKPLGFDWKIGIAVITSFAAREVFVGTLATIYSVGTDEGDTIKNRLKNEVNPITGAKVYTLASGLSLLLFYAFAMQCMSTLAIVKRETNSWKWPMIQLVFMSGLAYIVAFICFQLLS